MHVVVRRIAATGVALVMVSSLVVSPVLAGEPPSSRVIEALAPPPTDAESRRLAALHPQRPVLETSGDISTTVTVHEVRATIATDEEWRVHYFPNGESEARNRMETADNAMFSEFGIDFVWIGSVVWFTQPQIPNRAICNASNSLLDELRIEVPVIVGDVVLGYTNTSNGTGCSVGNHAVMDLHGSTVASRKYNVWTTSQHEFSHFFGAPDRYAPAVAPLHQNDVMENQYNDPDFWCTQSGYNDWGIVNSHRAKYD